MRSSQLNTRRHRLALALTVALLSANLTVAAPGDPAPATTQPMSAETAARIEQVRAANANFEAQSIGAPTDANANGVTPNDTGATGAAGNNGTAKRSAGLDFTRVASALAIVVALIVGARLLFRKFFAGANAPATSKAVRVIGRTSLAPRQQVLLLQIGGRVVVVGESNGNLNTLAQIKDADEVARLLGQLQDEQIQRGAAFGGLFSRVQKRYEETDEPHAPATESTGDAAPIDPAHRTQAAALEDEQLHHAKSELSGLVEKVRSLRSQLGQE